MEKCYIKITGSGTPLEIVDALSSIQKSILASTDDELKDFEQEGPTLMTEIHIDE